MSESADSETANDPGRSFDAALATAGDREAFVRLVRSTGRLVFSTVMLAVGDPHLADDLTQETFLRAWRRVHTLTDPNKFNAWLLGIARSVCVDEYRHRSRKKRTLEHPNVPDTHLAVCPLQRVGLRLVDYRAETPLDQLDQKERREKLLEALRSLPTTQQQVLSMRYLADADYDTIATQLNLTDGALRGHLHRGLAALRETLTRGTGVPPVSKCAD